MQVPWGTVPDWVEAIGTAGALLFGFYLLLRGQRKEERAQADEIAYNPHSHTVVQQDDLQPTINYLEVHNTSTKPISHVELHALPVRRKTILRDDRGAARFLELLDARNEDSEAAKKISRGFDGDELAYGLGVQDMRQEEPGKPWWMLPPGEKCTLKVETIMPPRYYLFLLVFVDARQRHWQRNLSNSKLKPTRDVSKKIFRKEFKPLRKLSKSVI
jgi:hypothetical protein